MKGVILIEKSEKVFDIKNAGSVKELLPVYDRPMIQFSLAVLMQLGIRDIIIASPEEKITSLEQYFMKGNGLGLSINYRGYDEKRGELAGILACDELISDYNTVVIKGDNIFYGEPVYSEVLQVIKRHQGYTSFATRSTRYNDRDVRNQIDDNKHHVMTGLHVYDKTLLERARQLYQNEFENNLLDINKVYNKNGEGRIEVLNPWVAWMKVFDYESLLAASSFIFQLEQTHGIKTACIEEIAYKNGFIDKTQFYNLYQSIKGSSYADYLLHFLESRQHKDRRMEALVN